MASLNAEEIAERREVQKQIRQDAARIVIECASLPPINLDDAEQIQKRIAWYFNKCLEEGYVLSIEGMCNALHVTKKTFMSWLDGTSRKGTEHMKIAQLAFQTLTAYMEGGLLSGDIPAVPAIFVMSNNYGYVQKQTISAEISESVLDTATPEQLEKRYQNAIDVVAEEVRETKEIEMIVDK